MIYSGVDLIRKSESTQVRAEKFAGPRAVSEPQAANKDPDQQGALLRFARFVNKERKKKPASKSNKHPYAVSFQRLRESEDTGQLIDIKV
jgi:hypothetical protein